MNPRASCDPFHTRFTWELIEAVGITIFWTHPDYEPEEAIAIYPKVKKGKNPQKNAG